MLIKIGAKNFYSFNEGIELSFQLGKNCPQEISNDKRYSNIMCIKGANGSGKTNILKILSFLKRFCCNSFENKPEQDIVVDSFFNNEKVVELFIEFETLKIKYRYEVTLTQKEILSEIIYKKERRSIAILIRKKNEIDICVDDYKELKKIKLRTNASIISTAHQYEIKNIAPIYSFLNSIISNVGSFGFIDFNPPVSDISMYYNAFPDNFEFVKKLICSFDMGIDNIKIFSRKDENGSDIFYPGFFYKVDRKERFLTIHTQSSGTKTLYNRLSFFKNVLDIGGILVLDELEMNLHPDILPHLLRLFTDEKINKKNAQLIFTTHITEIMDICGKYRTFLVNKENNESYGYRLDEIPGDILRNDRPISPIYKAGKIGGIPKI